MTRKQSVRLGAVAVALSVGAIAATWWSVSTPSEPIIDLADDGDGAPVGPHADIVAAHHAGHGQKALSGRYDIEANVSMASTIGDVQRDQRIAVSGQLHLGLPADRAAAAKGWVVGRAVGLKAEGDRDLAKRIGMAADGEASPDIDFALRVDERGEVVERRFAKHAAEGTRNLVALTAAAAQVVRPAAKRDAARWQTTENGASVSQYARYDRVDDEVLQKVWSRSRDGLDNPADANDDEPTGAALSTGKATLTYTGPVLQRVAIEQVVKVNLSLDPRVQQKHHVQTDVTMKLRSRVDAPLAVVVGGLAPESSFESLRPRVRAKPTTRGVQPILDASKTAQDKRDWHKRRKASNELAANINGNMAAKQDLRAMLWLGKAKADALRTAVEALGTTEDPTGRAMLAELIGDKAAPYTSRWHAIALMVTLRNPGKALVDVLMKVSHDETDDAYKTATAALAAVVHRARKKDPTAEKKAYGYMMRRATATFEVDHARRLGTLKEGARYKPNPLASGNPMLWVMALGNLGGEKVFKLVQPYLVDNRKSMRRHAIGAMRFIPTNPARLAIVKAMQRDPSPYNRRAAAETALYHPQYLMEEHVVRSMREDLHPEVQLGAAWTLAVWGVTAPALYQEIRNAAERADNKMLKKTLLEMAPHNTTNTHVDPMDAWKAKAKLQHPRLKAPEKP